MHDQNAYNDIRQTLKENTSLLAIQSKIDKAITVPPTKGSIINAYEHMWGYFKNQASKEEKLKARCMKEMFLNNELSLETLLKFLKHLSVKYEVIYLQ